MDHNLLPPSLSLAVAAELLGRSRRLLARYVRNGSIASVLTPGGRHRIPVAECSRVLHRPVTAEDILKAERKREKARDYQATYRQQHVIIRSGSELMPKPRVPAASEW